MFFVVKSLHTQQNGFGILNDIYCGLYCYYRKCFYLFIFFPQIKIRFIPNIECEGCNVQPYPGFSAVSYMLLLTVHFLRTFERNYVLDSI